MLTDALIWIVNTLFAVFRAGFDYVWSLLPTWPIDAISSLGPAATMFEWFWWLNAYLPLAEAVVILGLQVAWWVSWSGVHGIVWALQRARIVG